MNFALVRVESLLKRLTAPCKGRSEPHLFYMQELSYFILFGAVETEEITVQTYFQEHNIQ